MQTASPALPGPGSKDWKGGSVPLLPLALLSFTKAKLSTAENPSQHVNHGLGGIAVILKFSFPPPFKAWLVQRKTRPQLCNEAPQIGNVLQFAILESK